MNVQSDEWTESAAAYALGALDADERASFEAHLADCPACRTEVDSYVDVVAMLALSVTPVTPPDASALRSRIIRDARQVRPMPTRAQQVSTPPGLSRRSANLAWVLAAAAVIMGGMSGVVWRSQRVELDRLRAELEAARAAAAADDAVLAALLGPEVHVVSLSAPGRQPDARVFWNHTAHQFIVTAFDLPPAPAGRTYQLWAMPAGQAPISMGTFDTDANGRVTTTLAVSDAIENAGLIDACGLTLEPAGGSPQPTESPRLSGAWRHAD